MVAAAVAGCFASVQPQLPDDVATALARTPMRRLDTDNLQVYYPEPRRDEAYRFALFLESCTRALEARALIHNRLSDAKKIVIFPELTFNNAFTSPTLPGYAPFAVVPTYDSIDLFSLEMGLPPDPAIIACHELTHYVHLGQMAGFWYAMNLVFGNLITPQLGLDSWFDEGLAVYYETLLQPGVGRLAWPYWNGEFAAGVAGRRLNGGDMSALNRDAPLGNHYIVGSHFVRFLAERYGEWHLWKLIEVQGRSIFFPLWVDLRFWQAYDKTLSTLIDEFADDTQRRYPVAARPAGQRPLFPAGTEARYGRARDGTEAIITADHDLPARLVVRAPDGRVRFERDLTDVLPLRTLAISSPQISGPPSFTADGGLIYFTALDLGPVFDVSRLVRVDATTGDLTIAHRSLRGGGGSISPDGRSYAFAQADGDHHDLAVLDLASGAIRVLARQPPGGFVSIPRYAPDGRQLVTTVFDGRNFTIRTFDATTGKPIATLTDGKGTVHDASWADATHVVYLGSDAADAGFQVHVADLASGGVGA